MTSPVIIEQPAKPSLAHRSSTAPSDRIVLYGVGALLMFGPLAFGATEAWSLLVLEAGTAGLFLLWAYRQLQRKDLIVTGNPLFAPILGFAVLIGIQLAAGATAYRYATYSQALQFCAYGTLGFLIVQTLRRTSQVKIFATSFIAYGLVVAVFAIVQGISPNGKLYWLRTPSSGGWIYGPYVNHNHYAGLMELLVPIPIVAALHREVRGWRKAMAASAAAIMASSIFLSGSRGGMTALAVELALVSALVLRREVNKKTAITIGTFLVIAVGMLAWLGGGELTHRMLSIRTETQQELSGGTRLAIDRDALRMFAQRPVLGWGLGAFPEAYPRFRSFYTNFFVNAAHNDYAQLLVEMGTLGFAAMLWFLVTLYRRAISKLRDWPSDINGAVALAPMLAITGILVHSFVDFNLQVPANAALFYVMCVVAAMEPRFGKSRRPRSRHSQASV